MLKEAQLPLTYCLATSLAVLVAVEFGFHFVRLCREHSATRRFDVDDCFFAWDGQWYERITAEGYSYDPRRQSSVAFYPGYPLAAAALSRFTGLPTRAALLTVTHIALLADFVLLAVYARARDADARRDLADYVLLAFGLLPTTFYFRMAYSESLFMLLVIAAMLGIQRGWRPVCIALAIGLATATRPLGVALLLPFAMHLWDGGAVSVAANDEDTRSMASKILPSAVRAAALLPLACWGIVAYIVYQWWKFDEPLAFVKTQVHWGQSAANVTVWQRVSRLLTLAPIRAVYDAASPCYWGLRPPRDSPLFNLMFANPLFFLMTAGCVILGARKRWLDRNEVALSAMLLLIPYVTQADRTCMASQARFASVVFPLYLVLGHILARLPGPIVALLVALSAVMLALYSAMFVNWYWFY